MSRRTALQSSPNAQCSLVCYAAGLISQRKLRYVFGMAYTPRYQKLASRFQAPVQKPPQAQQTPRQSEQQRLADQTADKLLEQLLAIEPSK